MIQQTQNNISFGSKLAPTKTLKRVISDAYIGELASEDTAVLNKAIKSLINDGKNDIIEITEKTKGYTRFLETSVNDTIKLSSKIFSPNYREKSYQILRTLKVLAKERNPKLNFNELSTNEINALKPELKVLQDIVNEQKPTPDMFNIFDKISDIRAIMDMKRHRTNLDDLHDLENKIFDKNI